MNNSYKFVLVMVAMVLGSLISGCSEDEPPSSCPSGRCTVYGVGGSGGAGANSGISTATGGSTAQPVCSVGTERCNCYGNGTCNSGFTCASGMCVNVVSTNTGGSGGSAGSSSCTAGTELCSCIAGTYCGAGLVCVNSACYPDNKTVVAPPADNCTARDNETNAVVTMPVPGVSLAADEVFSLPVPEWARTRPFDYVREQAASIINCANSASCMAATRCAPAGSVQFVAWGSSDVNDVLWQNSYSGNTRGYCFYSATVVPGATLHFYSPRLWGAIQEAAYAPGPNSGPTAIASSGNLDITMQSGDRGPIAFCVLAQDSILTYNQMPL